MPFAMFALFPLAALASVLTLSWSIIRRRLLAIETCTNELRVLGVAADAKFPGTAVICGGSVGGLLTARVCHDHFERVIIVEPEAWVSLEEGRAVRSWTQSQTRTRLIQYQSLQVSIVFLYQGLLRLFPNLDRECQASDINVAPGDFTFQFWAGPQILPYAQYLGNLPKTLFASRQALETLIRRLTLTSEAFPNIHQMVGTVVGMTKDASNPGYLQQVRVRTKDGEMDIDAALVVDCTGSTQGSMKWLPRTGFGSGSRDEDQLSLDGIKIGYDPKIRYSTIRCVVTPSLAQRLPVPGGFDNHGGGIFTLVADNLIDSRYLACVKYEGNSVLMCCGARGSESLPVDLAGVREHVAAIEVTHPIPDWFWVFLDMLHEVEDTLTCSSVTVPPSFWTHFENATNLPSNWIALGDSVARLNPVFGHGCPKVLVGVACLNALLLEVNKGGEPETKRRPLPINFSRRFFKTQAAKIVPMETAKTIDYGFATTIPIAGETLELGSFRRWFIRHLQLLSITDQQAGSIMWHSQMMLNSTSIDALHPVLLVKVLWLAFKSRYHVV